MKSPEINQFNFNPGLLTKYKAMIYSNATWHKVEVENASKLDRDAVLRTIMTFVHPLDFIPVCYEAAGPVVSFLLKNCGAAIERLCRHNLIVANPQDATLPFKIKIILNFAYAANLKINIQNNITSILTRRFNPETGVLNLEMFYKDPELSEFCTLSQPKLMFYILHLSRTDNRSNQPKSIKLSNNEIEVLKPLEALFGLKTLTALDLRNNNIREMDAANFKDLLITELWLDGNPICDGYDEFTYPKAMKEMIPTLERLDGVYIQNKGMLPFRRNFLCSAAGHDLVDQFLEHYFNLYDTRSRALLQEVYHKDAMFSLTANYLALQTTSMNAKLMPYKKVARNLKMMSDFSKNDECLYRGRQAIVRLLTSLPATEHDPYTFTVDLVSFTETGAVLVVAGVFREAPDNLLESDRLLGFSRTFVLLAEQNNEYSIVNEQMHVSNATSTQALRSFKQTRIVLPLHIQIPVPQNAKEQLMLADTLVTLTGLNIEWATKCLEECNYELKRSLELFVDLFKLDKIPTDAFRTIPLSEKVQTRNPAAVPEKGGEWVSHPVAANVPAQGDCLLLPEDEQGGNALQLGCTTVNRATKKEQSRKRAEPQELCSNISGGISEGETIDLEDDECIIVEENDIPHNQLLPLPKDCKVSPYGVFEDYEPFMYPKPVDGVAQWRPVTKPETTDFWHTVSELVGFREKFAALKGKCGTPPNGYYNSVELAMEMVSCYGYHVATYQTLLVWYFPRHKPAGREFCKRAHQYVAANGARCISLRVFETLMAECEIVRGTAAIGKERLKSLIADFPRQPDAAKALLRHLCTNSRMADNARKFVDWALKVPDIDRERLIEIVKEHEALFKVNILSS